LPATWLDAVNGPVDVHLTTLVPHAVRGNHFHKHRRELLVVQYGGPWSVYWDAGEGTVTRGRPFEGQGAVLLDVPPLISHAVRNDGPVELHIIGLCDRSYDPTAPDAHFREVVAE
jgi:dTDP-4-dehydrorhamnose 3,5-epimerase-like enzyme